MDREEAVNKLMDYMRSIEVDNRFYNSQVYREKIELDIERQIRENRLGIPKGKEYKSFEIGVDEPGVFVSYEQYLGYYCYDFAFYFRIPTHPGDKPKIDIWTANNDYGAKRRIYGWTHPERTYDITSLVMKTSQKHFMNWDDNPLR